MPAKKRPPSFSIMSIAVIATLLAAAAFGILDYTALAQSVGGPMTPSKAYAADDPSRLMGPQSESAPGRTALVGNTSANQIGNNPNPVFAGNDVPPFGRSSYTRSVFENASAGTLIGEPVAATFDGEVNYSLGGTDAAKFNVDTNGQLSTKDAIGDYESSESQKSYTLTVTATAGSDNSLQAQASVSVTVVNLIEYGETVTVGDVTWTRIPKTRFLIAYEGTGANQTRRPDLEINYQPHCTSSGRQFYPADMWVDGQQLKARWRLDDENAWRPVDSHDPNHMGWDAYDLTSATTDANGTRKGIPDGCGSVYNDVWNDSDHLYGADIGLHILSAYELSDEGTTITRAPQLDIPLIDAHYTSNIRLQGIWGNSQYVWATQGRNTGGVPRGVAYDRSTFLNVPDKDMAFHGVENVLDAHFGDDVIWVQNLNDLQKIAPFETTPTPGEFHHGTPRHARKAAADYGRIEDTTTTNPSRISGRDHLIYVMHLEHHSVTTFDVSTPAEPRLSVSEFDAQDIPDYNVNECFQTAVPSCPTGISTENPFVMYFSFEDGEIRFIQKITPDIGDEVTLNVKENTPGGLDIGLPVRAAEQSGTYTWTTSGDDAQFFDRIASGTGDRFLQIRTKDGVSYNHETKAEYSFDLIATDSDLDEATSTVTVAITDVAEPPATPDVPTVSAGANATSLDVEWAEPANTGPPINDYDVQYSTAETGPWVNHDHEGADTQATIEGLQRSTAHWARVRASNDEGTSEWSQPAGSRTSDNSAPEFTAGATATRQLAENSSEGTNVGDPLAAKDGDNDAITFEITGTNDGSFTIDGTTGQIKAGDHDYDHETDMEYTLTVQASDPYGGTATIDVTVAITDVDEPPGAPLAPTVTAGDNATSLDVEWVEPTNTGPAVNDYDVQYSTSETGPWDTHDHTGNNRQTTIAGLQPETTYWVRVAASNGEGTSEWSESASAQTSSNSAPEFTAGATATRQLAENSAEGTNVGDPLATTDSDDEAIKFEITGANDGNFTVGETTGQIKAGAHEYDHEKDMEYTLTVRASDPHGGIATINVAIAITDLYEPPGKPAAPDITAATTTTLEVKWTAPANQGPAITSTSCVTRRKTRMRPGRMLGPSHLTRPRCSAPPSPV